MIAWGWSGQRLDLGVAEERDCATCGKRQPFRVLLVYRCFYLYWIFKRVTEKHYWLSCEVCENGWELESQPVERSLDKSPIPVWDRYGLAAFGVVVTAFVGIAIASVAPPATRDQQGAIATAGEVSAFRLQLGDCFNDEDLAVNSDDATEVSEVAGVPCSEPHGFEVYAVFNVERPAYPGEEQISEIANEGCLERFEGFVGTSYDTSSLYLSVLMPTSESWTQRGDREVACSVRNFDYAPLVGSAEQSGL